MNDAGGASGPTTAASHPKEKDTASLSHANAPETAAASGNHDDVKTERENRIEHVVCWAFALAPGFHSLTPHVGDVARRSVRSRKPKELGYAEESESPG